MAPALEGIEAIFERRPVRLHGRAWAQVGVGNGQHIAVRQVIRNAHAAARVANHPRQRTEHGCCHLQRSGTLVRHKRARCVDVQLRSGPPAVQVVAQQQHAQLVHTAGDLIVHDALARLQFAAAHL